MSWVGPNSVIPANCEVQGQEQIKYIHIRSSLSFNVLILDGSIEYDAHVLSEICNFDMLKAFDYFITSSNEICLDMFFLYTCATCSKLPSPISTII